MDSDSIDQMEGPESPPPPSAKKSISGCSTDRCNDLITNLSQSTTVQRLLHSIATFGPTPTISCLDCTNNNLSINTTTRAVLYDATPLQILVGDQATLIKHKSRHYYLAHVHKSSSAYVSSSRHPGSQLFSPSSSLHCEQSYGELSHTHCGTANHHHYYHIHCGG